MKAFVLLTLMISLNACGTTKSNDCAWVKRIITSEADKAYLVTSRPLLEQLVAHNEKVKAFCR